jgi:hypothetical protein
MPRPGSLAGLALIIATMALAACSGRSASTSPPFSGNGNPSPSGLAPCDPVDIRTSSGTRIDLTGTWRGGQTVVYVRQEADCVWWMALSDYPDEALGSRSILVFRGNIHQDFTLRGEWMALVKPTEWPPRGSTTFEIDDGGATEAVILRSLEPVPMLDVEARPYTSVILTYVGPLPSNGLP